MGDVTSKIELLHNLFRVSLGLSILCLIVSVVQFIRLDIYNIINFFTGKQEKKGIQALQESGFADKRIKRATQLTSETKKRMATYKTSEIKIGEETTLLDSPPEVYESDNCGKTEILSELAVENETTVLQNGYSESHFCVIQEILLIHTNEIIE